MDKDNTIYIYKKRTDNKREGEDNKREDITNYKKSEGHKNG